jgi:peptidoglycan hydrolase-like protein with peptidoglycan-binding domain
MRKLMGRCAQVSALLMVVAIGLVAPAAPASAQAPAVPVPASHGWCSTTSPTVNQAGGWVYLPVTSSGSSHCIMRQGARGVQVETLQFALNHCYGENLRYDGDFGPLTRRALERAQRADNINDDGVYGPITRGRLEWAHIEGGSCGRVSSSNFP